MSRIGEYESYVSDKEIDGHDSSSDGSEKSTEDKGL